MLLRLPIQVEHVMSKNKTYLGQRYIEVNLAKKLVSLLHRSSNVLPESGNAVMPESHCKREAAHGLKPS